MRKFAQISSDLKTVVEARAAELKLPMSAVLELLGVSEVDWAKAADSSMLLRAVETVGVEAGPSLARDLPRETGHAAPQGKAVASQSLSPPKRIPFPVLRPSWPVDGNDA